MDPSNSVARPREIARRAEESPSAGKCARLQVGARRQSFPMHTSVPKNGTLEFYTR